ncbi:pyruvate ferredoxin oxidoreductase subunit gamma [Candidatus Solincola tengchongensis]|uniref:pyruvate ferredoxin oxidoreductase subunit gamma n=1 Tax=Candidatus Solincola tengchongensis TaxID=2900693 RepID=UPI00257B3DEC|nr:pyruvate ferredoxin oxidoreductase subunit gamma [Candidatus Solincola tengchongensis]
MLEIRFHGRGGQGAVTSAELLAVAAINKGMYAQAFPSFGPERRGAPVVAFCRVDDKRILLRAKVYEPDVVVVLDSGLLTIIDPVEGLKKDGILIINTKKSYEEIMNECRFSCRVGTINADQIAREELGRVIVNTTMLGAVVRATGLLGVEDLRGPLMERFGPKLGEKNMKALERAYGELVLKE